jgi:rhodanese-related sulfurtransferase
LRGDTPVGLESGVTVVDVRSLAAFEQAQIPGARHIPLEELSERAGELDGNRTIVLYDLALSEGEALQAAMVLYALGFTDVAVLEGGIQRWYAQGYSIEGTWLTPTPDEVGPPWTLTPLDDGEQGTVTVTVAVTETVAATRTLPVGSATPALTVTLALTPTRTGP